MGAVKKIALGVGGIVGLGVIGAGIFLATIDPNDYRDEITQVVNQQTGRELQIGEMKLSLFPHLGLSLQNAQLSNAKGFDQTPFVAVKEVSVGVAILPLLHKQLQVDALTLYGLKLHLQRNAQGVTNWDDLAKSSAEEHHEDRHKEDADDKGNPLAKLAALNIGGLDIQDSEIVWQDDQAQQRVQLSPFTLTSGAVTLNEFFDLDLSMQTEVSQPQLKVHTQLHAQIKLQSDGLIQVRDLKQTNRLNSGSLPFEQVTTDLAVNELTFGLQNQQLSLPAVKLHYDFKGAQDFALSQSQGELSLNGVGFDLQSQQLQSGPIQLKAEAKGSQLPNGEAKLNLSAQPALDLKAQTASLKDLQLETLNTRLNADVNVTELTDGAKINAKAELLPTDLRVLLKQLGLQIEAVDKMSDAKALTAFGAQINASYDTTKQALNASKIHVKLDDSTLSGNASLAGFDRPNIAFNLNLDKINLNRYLPPKAAKPQETKETAPAAEDVEIPLPKELLRKLTVNGTVTAGSVQFDKLNPQNIVATLKGKNGVYDLNPLKMNIFNSPLLASAKLDVSGKEAKYAFKTDAQNVPVGDVLLAFTDDDRIRGLGTIKADLTTAGERLSSLKQHLNGTAAANLKNGAVKGFNLAQSIRQAKAKIAGEKAAGSSEELKTDFSELIAEVAIINGVVDTKKLSAQAPFMRIHGSGKVDLVKESLDYLVKTKIVASDKGQGGEELQELNGLTIPVKLKGAWKSPDVGLDLGSILEQKAKQEVEQKIEEKKEEVKKQFEDQLKQNLFKGLKF